MKITHESEDIIVVETVLYDDMQRLINKDFTTFLIFKDRDAERELLYATERPHDDLKLEGSVLAEQTGAHDVETSGPRIVSVSDHHDVDLSDFISLRR